MMHPKRRIRREYRVAVSPLEWNKIALTTLAIITLMALFLGVSRAFGQEEKPTMKLSMRQAMELALQKNFDIQIRGLDTESAFADLLGTYGVYNFTLTEEMGFGGTAQRRENIFQASTINYQGLNSRINRKIFTGADISTRFNMGRRGSNSIQDNLNPRFSDSWQVSITQPILKNFGKLATENRIMINRNNVKISDTNFESQVITTLVDLQKRYWDLVSAYDAFEVAEDALELAKEQLEINKIKVEVGTMPEIEITAAEERVAARESELVDAQALIQRTQDNLKQAIVMEDWQIIIEPTDSLPDVEHVSYDFGESLETAYENRPEMEQLELQVQNNDISIAYARNQLKPELNISASSNLTSAGGTFVSNQFTREVAPGTPDGFLATLRDTFSGTNREWSVGASFVYIFDNDAAKGTLLRNEVQKRQNELRIEQSRYNIAVEVRNAIREIEISATQIEARRKALVYAERQLEAEQQKFQVGSSTNFEVLRYQNDLVSARYNVIVAMIRHAKALIDYEQATGTLLRNNSVDISTDSEGVTGAVMK